MRKGDQWSVSPGLDLCYKGKQQSAQSFEQHIQGFTDTQNIGIVFNIRRGRSEVQYSPTNQRLLCKGFQLCYEVMVDFSLDFQGSLHINLIHVRLEINDATAFAQGGQLDEATRALSAAEEIAANDPELLIDVALAWLDIEQLAQSEKLLATVASGIESNRYSVSPDQVRAAFGRYHE